MSGELFCPKCGSKHDTSDRYCQYCGEDLEEIIEALSELEVDVVSSKEVVKVFVE